MGSIWKIKLQSIGQSLVELGDLGGDAEVDGSVADFDDKTTNDVGDDLVEKLSVSCISYFAQVLENQIDVLTLVTTLSFLPWLYSDLATAASRRWRVLVSSF